MNELTETRRRFIINAAYFALVLAFVLLTVKYAVPWLLPFIIGYVIAALLRPAALRLHAHTKAGERFSACITLVLAYLLTGTLIFLGGAKLVDWGQELFSGLPALGTDVIAPALSSLGDYIARTLGSVFPSATRSSAQALSVTLEDLQGALLSISTTAVSSLGGLTAKLPSFFLAFFFTIISSLIISANYREVSGFLMRQIPEKYRDISSRIKSDALAAVVKYLIACVKLMGITFLELAAGFLFLRVQNAVPIALGISLLDALPVFGTGCVMIPWFFLTLLGGNYPLALGLGILYAIVTVVRNIIEPRIVGSQLGLHPLATLCAIYAGFKAMGVLGMVLFPIAVQILAGLGRSGAVKLWK